MTFIPLTSLRAKKIAYTRLYKAATAIIKRDDPCQIEADAEGNVTCIRARKEPKLIRANTLCCEGCKHHEPEGCTVDSLLCRVYSCYCPGSKYDEWPQSTWDELQTIRAEATQLGVPFRFRQSKAENFAGLK